MTQAWRWAGAVCTGTSHLKRRSLCQDSAACMSFETPSGPLMVAVVSDGAGSATHARHCSRMVCHGFMRAIARHIADADGTPPSKEAIYTALDTIRDTIAAAAKRTHRSKRAFAATMVAVIAAPHWTLIAHVGDGACAVSTNGNGTWHVPSWPWHGEYASTTSFVTEDPAPRLQLKLLQQPIERFAIFSDGLERLVLDHNSKTAFMPFFDRMLLPLQASRKPGRDRVLSKSLRTFLASQHITDRTDDDTSLILGFRT
jgi:hypothetical protein